MAAELADFVERWPDKAQLLYKFSGWTLHKDMRVEDGELDDASVEALEEDGDAARPACLASTRAVIAE